MSLYTGPMRCRFASLRLAAAAVFLVSVASIALIVAAMLDTVVDVSLPMPRDLSAQPAALIIDDRTDGRIRRDGSSSVDDEVRRRGLDRPLRIGVERLVPDSRINSGSARFEPTPIHGVAVADYADDDGGPETADRDRSTTTTSAEWETDDWLLGRLPVSDGASIWPSGSLPAGALQDDRILAQLRYVPRTYNRSAVKVIYLPAGLGDLPPGRTKFVADRCPVDACSLTASSRYEKTAAVRLLQGDAFFDQPVRKPPGQIWILWLLESPPNTPQFRNADRLINWTATYRSDSTIVTPYEKYVSYDRLNVSAEPSESDVAGTHRNVGPLRPPLPTIQRQRFGRRTVPPPSRNYAAGRTRLVAWFVSNCVADNRRYSYVQQLRQFIPVDVFGDCGEMKCPRSRQADCDRMIRRRYKFYLAFENSNCEQYVTEKFYRNALWNDVVPIVMGARKSYYEAVAPPHSFIHVDDFRSPRDLAAYLLRLNATDRQYNEYLAWKRPGRGRFVDTRFWCRLCAMAHDDSGHVTWYDDIDSWWRHPGTCVSARWPAAGAGGELGRTAGDGW